MKRTIKINCLLSSILAVSGSSLATAGNIYIEADGVAVNQQTSIQNTPGIPANSPHPPTYQEPRLRNYGGDGWASKLRLVIDDSTAAVTDFRLTLTDPLGQNFGSGGPQFDVRSAGREYSFAEGFDGSLCEVGPDFIPVELVNPAPPTFYVPGGEFIPARGDVPGDGDGNTLDATGNGLLVYHCQTTLNQNSFSRLFAPNHICATPSPTSFFPGANGCLAQWAGIPLDIVPGLTNIAVNPVLHLPASHINTQDPGGLAWDVTGGSPNPAVYIDTDPKQNFRSKAVHESGGGRGGGTFIIHHVGTLNDGDFKVTQVDVFQDINVNFELPFLPVPPLFGSAQSFTQYEFASNIVQSNSVAGIKNVPMMGLLGLSILFGGIVAIATGLRRSLTK